MPRTSPPGVVKETEPLSEEFIPELLVDREREVERLRTCLIPSAGTRPLNVWLHGPAGTGKTTCARQVINGLEGPRVKTAWVTCWSAQTFYAVLDTILQELRALVSEQRDVAFKYDRLEQIARRHPLIVALDEVDELLLRDRNATLYNLARLPQTGVVCISQSRAAFATLDERVTSRLLPQFVEFSRYFKGQLTTILTERAQRSFSPEGWTRRDVDRLAESSHGNARIAIQALRTAGYLADKERIPQIRTAHLEQGLAQSRQLIRHYQLKNLSEHHRLLYALAKDSPGIDSTSLWKAYRAKAVDHGVPPMQPRTFRDYVKYLVAHRFLRDRQDQGRGNRRRLWVVE